MILLRLQNRVLLPTIWLPEKEWKLRFADDPAALGRVLDRSARTVIEDLGGFGTLIRQARWLDSATKVCTVCHVEKSVLDFHQFSDPGIRIRGECKACSRALERDKELGFVAREAG